MRAKRATTKHNTSPQSPTEIKSHVYSAINHILVTQLVRCPRQRLSIQPIKLLHFKPFQHKTAKWLSYQTDSNLINPPANVFFYLKMFLLDFKLVSINISAVNPSLWFKFTPTGKSFDFLSKSLYYIRGNESWKLKIFLSDTVNPEFNMKGSSHISPLRPSQQLRPVIFSQAMARFVHFKQGENVSIRYCAAQPPGYYVSS